MSTEVGNIHYSLDLDDSKFKGKAKGASDELSGLSQKFKNAEEGSKMFATGLAIVGAGLTAFGIESIKAFTSQEDAMARLTAGLQNVGEKQLDLKKGSEEMARYMEINTKGLTAQASALQQVTRFSDENIISGQAMLTTFQLGARTIQTITPSMLDMAEAMRRTTGETVDLNQLGILFGKVMGGASDGIDGMTSALRRMGVIMTDAQKQVFSTGTELERASTLAKIVDFNFGGFAQAGGRTFAGQWVIMQNRINDFQEVVGQVLANAITPLIKGFNDWFTAMGGPDGLLKSLTKSLQELQPYMGAIIGFIIGGLIPAFTALVGFLWLTFEPLIIFMALGTLLGALVQQLITAFGGWNNIMLVLQPLLSFLGVVFTDLILPPLMQAWTIITTMLIPALQSIWDILSPILIPILQFLGFALSVIVVGALVALVNMILFVVTVIAGFVKTIDTATKLIVGAFTWFVTTTIAMVIDFVNGVGDWVHKMASDFLNSVIQMANSVHNQFMSLGDRIFAEVSSWPSKLYDWGSRMMHALADGIRSSAGAIGDAVKWALEQASKYLKGNSPPVAGPFKELDKWGLNVGTAWVEGFTNAFNNFSLPSISQMGLVGASDSGTSGQGSQNITIYVDKVGNMGDVNAIGRELGFRAGLTP